MDKSPGTGIGIVALLVLTGGLLLGNGLFDTLFFFGIVLFFGVPTVILALPLTS